MKIFKNLKDAWNLFWRTSVDDCIEAEQKFLDENREKAIRNLEKHGWTILSTNRRLFFYGFKIQKGEHIHQVSLREALEIN